MESYDGLLPHNIIFFRIHSCCSMYQNFICFYIVWPNNILWYGPTTCCLCICQCIDICFHLLVILNNAAISICTHILCGPMFSFLFVMYLRVELLDHVVTRYLIIWGTVRLSSKIAKPFYISNSIIWGNQFPYIFAHTSLIF
jgi:hypothetical protein